MISTSAGAPGGVSKGDKVLWLMSFGDLLTLVLAFFVSLIALSPINPRVSARVEPGTTIASSEDRGHESVPPESDSETNGLTLYLNAGDFQADRVTLSERAEEKLRTFVNSGSYSVKQVIIATCLENVADGRHLEWNSSTNRLLGLHRQFIDALPMGSRVRLQPWGTSCESSAGDVLTQIKLMEFREGHG